METVVTRALDGTRIYTKVPRSPRVGSFTSDVVRWESIVVEESALLHCIAAERAASKARARVADSTTALCDATARAAAASAAVTRASAVPPHHQIRLDDEFLNLGVVRARAAGRELSATELRLSRSIVALLGPHR